MPQAAPTLHTFLRFDFNQNKTEAAMM